MTAGCKQAQPCLRSSYSCPQHTAPGVHSPFAPAGYSQRNMRRECSGVSITQKGGQKSTVGKRRPGGGGAYALMP